MKTAYITHPTCLLHEMGSGHPESPARMQAIEQALQDHGLLGTLQQHQAPAASREQLLRVHSADYVDEIFNEAPTHGRVMLDPDTSMNPHTLQAALHAAGAGVLAVDLVMTGKVQNAFCNVRPPGHHACHNRAMGFCIFNNIAVAAAHALAQHGAARVAIADFDVHHGNGTEDIFHEDDRVMLCSTFQHPFYPHVGAHSGNDHIINVPLPAGTGSAAFRSAVQQHWLPQIAAFKPDLLLISAGFDAHREDNMAGLALQDEDYRWVTLELKRLAAECCNGRIVSMLEGGYALDALARSAYLHVKALTELNEK